MTPNQEKEFEEIKKSIASQLPFLARYFDYAETLEGHARILREYCCDPIHVQRQSTLRAMVQRYIERVHGVSVSVPTPLSVNIMDHHAMLNNPLSLATNIVANACDLVIGPKKPLVVFTTSLPSQENYFSDVRFRGNRIQFFSKTELPQATCFLPVHDFAFIDHLKAAKKWNTWSADDQRFLEWVEQILSAINYAYAQNLNDQISIMNRSLFPLLFAEDMREYIPDLFYVSNEDIVRECASEIFDNDSLIAQSVADAAFCARVLERFEGIQGCWNRTEGRGTHFFWYRKDNNRPAPLWLVGDSLVSDDSSFVLPLEREAIITALEDQRILPSLFVIYGWMTFFCGVRPLLGFGSLNYISKMKEAWIDVLNGVDDDECKRVESVDTSGLIGGLAVTYARDHGMLTPQYALDVIASGGLTKEYIQHLIAMPFHVLFAPTLLEIYTIYVPAGLRKKYSLTPANLFGPEFDWI